METTTELEPSNKYTQTADICNDACPQACVSHPHTHT